MNKPLISIIVPCYNNGEYIQECLNSVHNQEYSNYEIVVINDGSTDAHTNKVVKAIAHPKVKILETKNQGVSLARNSGIEASSGKYILPLDADDKIGSDFISNAINILENNPDVKVVSCDVELFGAKKGLLELDSYSLGKILAKNLLTVSCVFRRTDFDQTPGFNPNMKEGFEDWDFWLSLLKTGGKVHKIESLGFFYRIKQNSRNSALTKAHYKKLRRQLYENHKELYSNYLLDPQESFEYELILQSREYKLGTFLLKPIRKLYSLFH